MPSDVVCRLDSRLAHVSLRQNPETGPAKPKHSLQQVKEALNSSGRCASVRKALGMNPAFSWTSRMRAPDVLGQVRHIGDWITADRGCIHAIACVCIRINSMVSTMICDESVRSWIPGGCNGPI